MKAVLHHTKYGWPKDKSTVAGALKKFWDQQGYLSIHNDLLLRGSRLVIPQSLRRAVLKNLHDGHQGITKTRQLASQSVWWPGVSRDIDELVQSCDTCEKKRPERIEPMQAREFPQRPWAEVGGDFFHHNGKWYLLVVDYYSRDIEVCRVSADVDAAQTILKLKQVFSRHGICDAFYTDNGRQFVSKDFSHFTNSWNFLHITSSPHYPQSNGEAERAVQTVKNILTKCEDEYLGILSCRNTPLACGFSPAQLSMGRKLKTRVPCHPSELLPQVPEYQLVQRNEEAYRDKMAMDYNKRHRIVEPDSFAVGDRVWIPDMKREGTVTSIHNTPRSMEIDTDKGLIRRNRRMVKKLRTPEYRYSDKENSNG